MARNEVRLEFVGDDSQLTKTFANVGSEAKGMAADVGKASRRMVSDTDLATTGIAAGIDSSERRFRGFGDAINGTGDIMEGFRTGNVALLATGFADMAGAATDFIVPALNTLKTTILTGLAPAFTLIAAHPLIAGILAGGAIIAGLVLLEKKFGVVSGAIGFVKDAAGGLLDALGGVVRAFRDLWNNTIGGRGFTIPGVDLPGPFDIPGVSVRIPRLHSGGGLMGGGEGLAILQQGETVLPRGGAGSGGVVINISGVGMGRDFGDAVARALRDNQLIGVTI